MAVTNFVIPLNKSELLIEADDYYVKNVLGPKDLILQLKNAKEALKNEGPEFILENFDVYYSVLDHGDTLPMDIIFKAYDDLHRASEELNRTLGFIFEDKDSLNDEVKLKFLNIIKMLLYIYVQIVILLENKAESKNQTVGLRGRKKSAKEHDAPSINKTLILSQISKIIHRDINILWDPPVVEETFINMLSEVCYRFLQNPVVKADKELRAEIFGLIGTLIKCYSHGTTFVIRMVQLIKLHEHLVYCLPDGVQLLVQSFNCKGLVHDFVREVTEWQTDEKYQDSQGARYCALVLSEMAMLMPDLMIPEVMYLNRYLAHESAPLRNSVLTVIVEVILNVLTKHELSEEERESRDDFLYLLTEHMNDVSALVRSKVMQHWAKLQKENAIPLKYQHDILEKIIDHLQDKGALVRKNAAICVTTFLSYNLFGANLQLKKMEEELKSKQELLEKVKAPMNELREARLKELENQWNLIVNDLKEIIEKELEKELPEEQEEEIPKEDVSELIRMYLMDGKYLEAFQLCRLFGKQTETFKHLQEGMGDGDQNKDLDIFLTLMHIIFTDAGKILSEMMSPKDGAAVSDEEVKKVEALENAVDFLNDTVEFLKLMDRAIKPMADLLQTTTIGDMQEAIEFFIAAYHFNIDNADVGVLEMLNMMKRNEQERRDAVVNAFKLIYLNTDTKNMAEHTTTIANRLIQILKNVPVNNLDDLQVIITEWSAKGILDNSVIDMLWQYFTKKVTISDEDSRAATELLRMAAIGRKTIITRNIKLVATVAFGERGANDMLMLASSCNLLAVAGREKLDINSKEPPFKIKVDDSIFKDLCQIIIEKFFEPVEYYNKVLMGAVDFIYKMCAKPEKLCEYIITKVISRLIASAKGDERYEFDKYILMRLCQLLGFVAVKQLEFLDDTVYKELKRRNNIREERKEAKKNEKNNKKKPKKSLNASNVTANDSLLNQTADEMTLEGAQAEDTDAEFILNVLEHDTVSGSGGLGKLAYVIRNICERPDIYSDVMLQGTAVIALIRYMLVSSKFCQEHIQLLFTIFEKTLHPEVKCTILFHCSDLLTRFPNIVEPWTPKIYQRLEDPDNSIRKATFFTLSNLILRDMIRVHGHISEMAMCIVDKDEELNGMSKTFFVQLSHKENNLYNVLPDIFSHLVESKELSEENLRTIMKFLFDLIDKTKHMESLVDRFCCKYRLTENERHCINITYCLTLIHYNEKALKKLSENFPMFKHLLHIGEVYGMFKQIMAASNKQQVGKADLKPIVAEIEEKISGVFEINEGNGAMGPPTVPPPKSAKKGRRQPKKKPNKKKNSSDEDDNDDSEKENGTRARRSVRKRPARNITFNESDSD